MSPGASADLPDRNRVAIADAIAQTDRADGDRARCQEILQWLSAEERALNARLAAADSETDARRTELEAIEDREAARAEEIADLEASQEVVCVEIRGLQRQLGRLTEFEHAARRAFIDLEARTVDACSSAEDARDRLLRVSYRLTPDHAAELDVE